MKVITIGGATLDTFLCCKTEETEKVNREKYVVFRCGNKIELSELQRFTGGGSTNSAVSFRRMGFEVQCFCKIGGDSEGMQVLSNLKKEGVNTKHIAIAPKGNTGSAYIVSSPKGEQTVFVYRGISADLELKEIPLQEIEQSDLVYITSLNYKASSLLLDIAKHAKKHNKKVATNPGTNQLQDGAKTLIESLPYVDTLILNTCEAKTLLGSIERKAEFSTKNFIKQILGMGPSVVVVTDGANGVSVATEKELFFHPAIKVKVFGSLGAGDAFGSCFVGTVAKTGKIENALRCGIINAASVISYIGTKNGLLTWKQLEERLKKLDPSLLQKQI